MDLYEKKYKEALERARECLIDGTVTHVAIGYIEQIFPELKDNEYGKNKRISKEITQFLKQNNGWNREWLAWLEKQGEHAIACSEEQMKVLNEVLNFAANHESSYWNDYIFETLNNLIRQLYIAGNNDTLDDKDEEIRKALINVFATHKDYEMFFGIPVEDIRAWLEKQGQTFTKKDIDDAYLKGVSDAKKELEKQGEKLYE